MKNRILTRPRKHPGTKEARLLLEQYGRDLHICERCHSDIEGMHIHHKNGNPYDNILTNLVIVCSKCHRKIHGIIDWIDELDLVEESGIVDEDKGIRNEKPDKNLISVNVEELDPIIKAEIFQQLVFPEPVQIIRPKHHWSKFLGYQCRQCEYFRAFKSKCEIFSEKAGETDRACNRFKHRGETVY